jgi:tripartite-type tricarboxylate transporter receptor subunit TctC
MPGSRQNALETTIALCQGGHLLKTLSCLISAFLCLALFAAPIAVSAEDFYAGKTVRFVVGFSPGGGYDIYTRTIARHIGKHLPGKPTTVVENMPGAGSLISANYLYHRAKPDGLTIGNFIGPLVLQQVLGNKAATFDGRKFGWIGVPASDHAVCIFNNAAGIPTMKQWLSTNKTPKIGGVAPGSNTSDVPRILKEALNAPLQVVDGYKGTAEIALAMEAGEIDASCWSWLGMKATMRNQLEAGKVSVVVQVALASHPELKNVPLAIEFANTEVAKELIRIGSLMYSSALRPYATPPGTPPDRLALLRKAFRETMKDPAFLADAKQAQIEIDPIDEAETERIFSDLYKMNPATVSKLQDLLLPKGGK